MKLDFLGRYKEASALIYSREALAPKGAAATGFDKLVEGQLGSAQVAEPVKINSNLHAKQNQSGSEVMAQLSFSEPHFIAGPERLQFPPSAPKAPETITPSIEPTKTVSDTPIVSVKTPTLISATRITSSQTLSGMTPAERKEAILGMLEGVATKKGIDPALSKAVVAVESNFDPRAVSKDGHLSKGLFQILDSTGKHLISKEGATSAAYLPFEAAQNIDLGVGYLRYLHEIFAEPKTLPNDLKTRPAANSASLEKLAVAAFNAGEGRVASAQARAESAGFNPGEFDVVRAYLPDSTQVYVDRVMSSKAQFSGKDDALKGTTL